MAQYDADLRDYWRILKKRKVLIILMTLLAGGFSWFFAKIREPEPVYEAFAEVKIERRTNMADFFTGDFWNQSDSIATQARIIRSFPVLAETAKYMGRIPNDLSAEEIRNSEKYLSEIQTLESLITAEQEANTNILNIMTRSGDAREAAAAANAVAVSYRDYNIREKNRQTFETKSFIEEQLRITEERLRKTEEELRTFKETSGLLVPDAQTRNTLDRLFETEKEYSETRREKESLAAQLQLIRKAGDSPKNLENIFLSETEDESVRGLNKQLRDLVMKRKTLLFDFTEAHPQIMEINDQIQGLFYGIRKELESRVAGLELRENDLERKRKALQSESGALPEKILQLSRMERDVRLQESLYSELKTKYQEILIQAAGRVEEVTVIRPAVIPAFPVNMPSLVTVIASGIVMGLFAGIFLAFVVETLDTSIGTIEDVEKLLGIPVFGMIPQLKKEECALDEGRTCDLITHFEPDSLGAEAFRTIRTNLRFTAKEIKGKSFLITSAFLQEGKTFSAVNLAVSLAQSGIRVLLVDADLRNPSVHKAFGLNQSPGISDYVMGNCQQEEIIQNITDVMLGELDIDEVLMTPVLDNLHYVTSGTLSSKPAEILRSDRFQNLVRLVYPEYDMILIDSPPILPVADALDVAGLTDGVILVYTVGKIARGVLKRAKSAMDNVNAKVLGVILNNVKPETGPDYFKYHSRYYHKAGEKPERRAWGLIPRK